MRTDDPDEMTDETLEIGDPATVLNHVGGGGYTEAGLRTLERGGRLVICRRTTGDVGRIPLGPFSLSHRRVIGSTMGTQTDLKRRVGLVDDGVFEPVVGDEFALKETDDAFAAMRDRTRSASW